MESIEKLKEYKERLTKYQNKGFTWYEMEFKSMFDLYEYLACEPPINIEIFSKPSSLNGSDDDFYEVSYNKALNFLLGGYEVNLDSLLEQKQELEKGLEFPEVKRKMTTGVTGSRICINKFIANDPKRYYRLERINEKKFIKIHVNLAYSCSHSIEEVLNRGAILYNIIKILEENNYSVELDTFCLIKEEDELMYLKVKLKKINEPLSVKDSIFPLTSPAFFRRIIFRVMESMPVENYWGYAYGYTLGSEDSKRLLELPNEDIYISTPREMGIEGNDIYADAQKLLEFINMEKYVRVKVKK